MCIIRTLYVYIHISTQCSRIHFSFVRHTLFLSLAVYSWIPNLYMHRMGDMGKHSTERTIRIVNGCLHENILQFMLTKQREKAESFSYSILYAASQMIYVPFSYGAWLYATTTNNNNSNTFAAKIISRLCWFLAPLLWLLLHLALNRTQ